MSVFFPCNCNKIFLNTLQEQCSSAKTTTSQPSVLAKNLTKRLWHALLMTRIEIEMCET